MGRFECDPHAEAAALYLDGEPEQAERTCGNCWYVPERSVDECMCGNHRFGYCEHFCRVTELDTKTNCDWWELA